jgi:thiosulfate dehydrogenase
MYAYLDSISQSGKGTDAVAFTPAVQIQDIPAGDATRGGAVYAQACRLCHGTARSGAGKLVERAPILPDQTVAGHPSPTYSPTDRRLVFIEKTRHGAFLGYGGEMPPFSMEKLSDEQLRDLLAYFNLY